MKCQIKNASMNGNSFLNNVLIYTHSMTNDLNSALNDIRQTNEQLQQQAQKGSVDPLTQAKFQKLEQRLATLEGRNANNNLNGNEVSFGNDANSQYRDAFMRYILKGETSIISQLPQRVQLNNAGFTVAQSMESLICDQVNLLSTIRKIASVTQVSSDSLDLAIEDNGSKASWGEPTSTTTVVKKYIKAYDVVAQPKVTTKLLDDAEIDVEAYIARKIAESFAMAEDESFILGDGNAKPKGMLTLANGTEANSIEQISGAISFEKLMELTSSLGSFYSSGTSYLMNKSIESQIRFLKDTNDHYIWRPATAQGEVNTILGVPVYTTNYMPNQTGKASIIFGNFKQGYQVVEKVGVNLLRDPFTEKPFVKFYTLRRVGGDVIDGRALKTLIHA